MTDTDVSDEESECEHNAIDVPVTPVDLVNSIQITSWAQTELENRDNYQMAMHAERLHALLLQTVLSEDFTESLESQMDSLRGDQEEMFGVMDEEWDLPRRQESSAFQ